MYENATRNKLEQKPSTTINLPVYNYM